MLRPRITPCLLIEDGALVKTQRFTSPKYVGDPINAVRIFNEKEADEIMVLDISASRKGIEPDYKLISYLAAESRMPLCYGGGVKTVEQVEKIICLGVEKVAISSEAVKQPEIISKAADRVGSQSVVSVIDVKKAGLLRKHQVVTHNATVNTGLDPIAFAVQVAELGAGEIVINNVDNDGLQEGYDLELISRFRDAVNLPLTSLGGAGSLNHFKELIDRFGIMGAAAGSLFVFKGKYRAVLINYPNHESKNKLYSGL